MTSEPVEVSTTSWGLEYSVHSVPKRHRDEVAAVFPGLDLTGVLVVPTCQKSKMSLVNVGPDVDTEKDECLERFVKWAHPICEGLIQQGYWADYIDPCSGLPMIDRKHGAVYAEVEGLVALRGFETGNAGCCKIILHPKWGASVYPASLFSNAPDRVLRAALDAARDQADP